MWETRACDVAPAGISPAWRTDARPATWDYTRYTRQREEEDYEPRQLDYSTGLAMERAVRLKP